MAKDYDEVRIPDNSMAKNNIDMFVPRMKPGDVMFVPYRLIDYAKDLVRSTFARPEDYHIVGK